MYKSLISMLLFLSATCLGCNHRQLTSDELLAAHDSKPSAASEAMEAKQNDDILASNKAVTGEQNAPVPADSAENNGQNEESAVPPTDAQKVNLVEESETAEDQDFIVVECKGCSKPTKFFFKDERFVREGKYHDRSFEDNGVTQPRNPKEVDYLEKISARHAIQFSDSNTTSNSLTSALTLPFLKADTSNELTRSLVNYLNQTVPKNKDDERISHNCVFDKANTQKISETVTVQLLECGYRVQGMDEPEDGRYEYYIDGSANLKTDVYLCLIDVKEGKNHYFKVLDGVIMEYGNTSGGGYTKLLDVKQMPLLDSSALYVHLLAYQGSGGEYSTSINYQYWTSVFVGENPHMLTSWKDTDYSYEFLVDDSLDGSGTKYSYDEVSYTETSLLWDGKSFQEIERNPQNRNEFLKMMNKTH